MTRGQREDWRIAVRILERRRGWPRALARRRVNRVIRIMGLKTAVEMAVKA